jgi:metal-responsive CopG/Arc/MetJ family transcriptional regulator
MANGKALISDEMLREVEEAAAAEQRSVEEIVGDALRHYLDDRKWQTLVASSRRRAEAMGLTEDDVPRLVAEARRNRHAR